MWILRRLWSCMFTVHMAKDEDMLITDPILQDRAPFFRRNLMPGNRLVSVWVLEKIMKVKASQFLFGGGGGGGQKRIFF